MKLTFIWVGKTTESYLQEGIAIYENRLKHYAPFSIHIIVPKSVYKDVEKQKEQEGEMILAKITPQDEVYLMDERGVSFNSENLADFLQKKMSSGLKNLVLVIGGAFGFSDKVYQRANGMISLSKLTFSHQMVRLILCEQIYRAFTIIRGEPYHHAG